MPSPLPLILFLAFLAASASPLSAKSAPFRPTVLTEIDRAIDTAIAEKRIPGGVLWIEHNGEVYHKAYGNRALLPKPSPTSLDTIYDAASLTKVVATTPSIMLLVERGQLNLDDPVSKYLPKFTGDGKDAITIRHLLTHTSGLRPGIPRSPEYSGTTGALDRIYTEKTQTPAGTALRYSDINFILLGEIVRIVSGKPLDVFARDVIFGPLKMIDTGFLPPATMHPRIAPTTREVMDLQEAASKNGSISLPAEASREGRVTLVHDPTSRRMGGVAGHAGLFLTAADLARYSRMFLNHGTLDGARIFEPETIALMTRVSTPANLDARRALGWDIDALSSSLRGAHLRSGYGHTGWTGGAVWISPPTNTFIIFLCNRNHPDEKGSVKDLRDTIGTLAAEALGAFHFARVKNGIDVLIDTKFASLDGLTVGLITNHTGRSRGGASTIDLLHAAPNVKLAALFSPEHGIRGSAEGSVTGDTDAKTGLPIHSLYLDKQRKPTPGQLRDLDALVFDIQDIGCRFYTYISTMGNAMEAAAENKLRFIVIDRVNPIGGRVIDGPVLEGERSFIAWHDIPVRHGMTAGELARMFRAERKLDVNLTVVELENWSRAQYFDDTGLAWINPSPNMRSLTEALLYPGIGLLEFLDLSVGRGTDTPFEHIGAPYIDPAELVELLGAAHLPGIRFEATHYTPDASVFKGETCHGVKFTVTDRDQFHSVRTGIAIARALYQLYPDRINYERFQKLLVHPPTFDAVKQGTPLDEIESLWQPDLEAFKKRRARYLLY